MHLFGDENLSIIKYQQTPRGITSDLQHQVKIPDIARPNKQLEIGKDPSIADPVAEPMQYLDNTEDMNSHLIFNEETL